MTVYLILDAAIRAVKIGFTDGDPEQRRRSLQTNTSGLLELIDAIPDASREVEARLHERFEERRIRGEWFVDRQDIRAEFRRLRTEHHREHLLARVRRAGAELDAAASDEAITAPRLEHMLESVRYLLDVETCGCIVREDTSVESVRAFWQEFRGRFSWDLVPFPFLYDLYRAWLPQASPASSPISRQQFVSELFDVVRTDIDWYCREKSKKVRPGQMMSAPEPLIAEYGLKAWFNPKHSGVEPLEACQPNLQTHYRGILRRVPQLSR